LKQQSGYRRELTAAVATMRPRIIQILVDAALFVSGITSCIGVASYGALGHVPPPSTSS